MLLAILALTDLLGLATAQQAGTVTTERHPKLAWKKCLASGACINIQGEVTIDANWRWVYDKETYADCHTGNGWNKDVCRNGQSCANRCALDGADYAGRFGVSTCGNSIALQFVNDGADDSTNIGSRLYLMASPTKYQMFTLLGNEFTFDVDTSRLGCGMNGALYFVSMDEDGGMAKYPSNKAGAKYGTGYCDAQCPQGSKFINGEANLENEFGSCCSEVDIWQANAVSTAFTAHPCETTNQHRCEGDNECSKACTPDNGCTLDPFRLDHHDFYGPGARYAIDSTRPLTVVTQFVKGSDGGLAEIRRFYVQDGRVIPNVGITGNYSNNNNNNRNSGANSSSSSSSSSSSNSTGSGMTGSFCRSAGNSDAFVEKGGMAKLGKALAESMVLVMALWDDYHPNVLWRDSSSATDLPGSECDVTVGVPAEIELEENRQVNRNYVIFSNIRFGPIGSTFRQT
ncbi:hypothetical protein VTJ49DRAFT_6763 [Mycothermus thermophilus]|uniref:Glucanase n=1 Tax=Humicola insolens TaxID=85995 RepID=A0ABR3VIV6_HUMIN